MITINATECDWITYFEGESLTTKISSLNWSSPIKPILPITMFGKSISKFQIGKYGQLKFLTYPDGRFKYSDKEFELPESINKLEEGFQIIPFGEPIKIKGCGITVTHGIKGSLYIVNFNALSLYNGSRQQFQVIFDTKKHNEVKVQYKSVLTGYNTIVGAVGESYTGEQWYPLENHKYHNTALLINTNVKVEKTEPIIEEESIVEDPSFDWTTDWQWEDINYVYRVQRKALK